MVASRLKGGTIGLGLIALAGAASAQERHDPCAYMNHDSEAYKECISEQAEAPKAATIETTMPVPAVRIEPAKAKSNEGVVPTVSPR